MRKISSMVATLAIAAALTDGPMPGAGGPFAPRGRARTPGKPGKPGDKLARRALKGRISISTIR